VRTTGSLPEYDGSPPAPFRSRSDLGTDQGSLRRLAQQKCRHSETAKTGLAL
jgi:hypothetical protein